MAEANLLSRRAILVGAATIGATAQFATMLATTAQEATAAAAAVDLASLERVKVELATPPFVHAHDQIATGAPKIVEFTMGIEE